VDVAEGKVVRTFPVDTVPEVTAGTTLSATALSPDERWYAHGALDGTIRLRDARTGALSRTIGRLDAEPAVLAFSPDGARLLGADEGGVLKIWDITTGREVAATTLTGVLIRSAGFSADGKRLAVGGLFGQLVTGEVRILDAEDAHEIWSLKGHTFLVHDALFSPDGLRLATDSLDGTVRIWDLSTGQEILKLSHGMSNAMTIRFVSDGRRLISTSRDRQILVWDATPLPE
jgi:WD40 repeat protein